MVGIKRESSPERYFTLLRAGLQLNSSDQAFTSEIVKCFVAIIVLAMRLYLRRDVSNQREVMSEKSKIEWADHTFNLWVGCTKVSPGCDHCYAES